MRVARASFTRRTWVMMAAAEFAVAAIAVLLLAIVTEADWDVKRCCTDFEPEPETMNQQEMLTRENEKSIRGQRMTCFRAMLKEQNLQLLQMTCTRVCYAADSFSR